jgi:eukaryotic-like serine/threonine-protein kinase
MAWFALSGAKDSRLPQPGQFGPYYLQELINSGGMANIWLATDPQGQVYALRRLHHALRFNLTAKRRFVRGADILSRIHNHEFVVGYYGHGKVEGDHYLLMEYVEGDNLKLLSTRSDAMLGENIANVLIDMAVALEHVHESGFMHLDFKPENLMLSRNGSLRLVDFDSAQPRPSAPKKMSENPGTPAYMAPEQIRRQPVDHRTDQFAYGVTAFELLCGRKPFAGDNAEDILRRHYDRTLDFAAPRELNPDIPLALEKVILKCLELPLDRRYPYTSVLVRDLQAALYV